MKLRKYLGFFLVLIGFLLLLKGGVSLLINRDEVKSLPLLDMKESVSEDTNVADTDIEVDLPGVKSWVGSPLLVRGKVYGPYDFLVLRLYAESNLLTEASTTAKMTNDSDGFARFQESLVFDLPDARYGYLVVRLMSDDKIVNEKSVPIIFKGE